MQNSATQKVQNPNSVVSGFLNRAELYRLCLDAVELRMEQGKIINRALLAGDLKVSPAHLARVLNGHQTLQKIIERYKRVMGSYTQSFRRKHLKRISA